MSLILVSNRGPVEYVADGSSGVAWRPAPGGLASALSSVARSTGAVWVAAATTDAPRRPVAEAGPGAFSDAGFRLRLVSTPPERYELFYRSFSNPILWFLQHSLWDRLHRPGLDSEIRQAWDEGYLPVNQAFAEAVAEELRRADASPRVMLHDYHLYAAPLFIRDLCPMARLQHFVHIPWPAAEQWAKLPGGIAQSICEGLLANDSVVFQTPRSVRNFLLTCWALLPAADVDLAAGTVSHRGRRIRAWANPISVDVFGLRARLSSPRVQAHRERLAREAGDRTIVRVDRLDPSKNVLSGFQAFELLLRRHPEWLGRVRFLAFLVPSRTAIPEYRRYAEESLAQARAVNARFGTAGWEPIRVHYEHNPEQALAAMSLYDVLLVNSVADGMNLVSKEGPVVNQRDGVLVLSTTAGAYPELAGGAIGISPEDIEGTAAALHRALSLPPAERHERALALRQAVLRHDIRRWLERQLADLVGEERAEELVAAVR